MDIKYFKTWELNPYEKNPRKNDSAVGPVMESIKQFGFKIPITVDKNMTIVTGHTRLKAAIKLGLDEVPVIILNDLTDDQIKAFRLVDNKTSEYAEWDFKALALELEDIQMDLSEFDFEIPEEQSEIEEDDFEIRLPDEPKSRLGDLYKLGSHYLMCGDSTNKQDVDKLMGQNTIDLIVTDPPYNVNYGEKGDLYEKKGGYNTGYIGGKHILNDNMETTQFLQFLTDAFIASDAFLKFGGSFYIWHAETESFNFRQACLNAGWKVRQCLIWNKNALVLGRQDYQWKHEPCLYGWKEGAAHYFIEDRSFTTVFEEDLNIDKLKLPEAKKILKELLSSGIPSTIIDEQKPTKNSEHPTMKPLKLIGRLIKNSSKPNQKVLDMFGGSGSTLIAAEQLKRKCFMMELDPKYVDVIIERWERYTGKVAEKI